MVIFTLFFLFLSISHRTSRDFIQIQPVFRQTVRKYFCRNINIYLKINFHLLHLSRYDYCIYTCAHKVIFYYSAIDAVYRYTAWVGSRWVGSFRKLKFKSDSLLGICLLLKKIVHVLMFYILSHVISGLLTFSNGLNVLRVTWLHAVFLGLHYKDSS